MQKMFMVECRRGRFALRAASRRQATTYARREYGLDARPFTAKPASVADLQEHLRCGAVFFDVDDTTIPRDEAYAMIQPVEA